jgi:hypothetical protein
MSLYDRFSPPSVIYDNPVYKPCSVVGYPTLR